MTRPDRTWIVQSGALELRSGDTGMPAGAVMGRVQTDVENASHHRDDLCVVSTQLNVST
jgi:hypothetical protein